MDDIKEIIDHPGLFGGYMIYESKSQSLSLERENTGKTISG